MAATYEKIATTTLGSAQATVEFTSITQSYTDLVIVTNSGNSSGADHAFFMQVGNGSYDTGSNYSSTYMFGNGSSVVSGRESNQTRALNMRTGGTLIGNGFVHCMNYSNTTTYKTFLSKADNADTYGVNNEVGLWRNTAAITSIVIANRNYNFSSGSTFTLYGIKSA